MTPPRHPQPDLWHLQLDPLKGLIQMSTLQNGGQQLRKLQLPVMHLMQQAQPPFAHQASSMPNIRGNPASRAATSKKAPKPDITTVSDSEYTYVYPSSSDESGTTEDKSIDKTPVQTQVRNPLQLAKEFISNLKLLDTLEVQSRVLMSKACDPSVSLSQVNQYILDNNFHVFNAKEIDDTKPYRCLCIFGPPNIGKGSAAGGMNAFIQGTQVTTTSKKFYKYVNEKNNTNMFHFCNDSFASNTGIAWDRLTQSIHSITHGVGKHFVVVGGHSSNVKVLCPSATMLWFWLLALPHYAADQN